VNFLADGGKSDLATLSLHPEERSAAERLEGWQREGRGEKLRNHEVLLGSCLSPPFETLRCATLLRMKGKRSQIALSAIGQKIHKLSAGAVFRPHARGDEQRRGVAGNVRRVPDAARVDRILARAQRDALDPVWQLLEQRNLAGGADHHLLAGRVQSSFLSTLSALSNAKDGKLRPLAVLLEKRSPLAPDVPTIAEAGVPQVTVRQWAGVFGPPKLPRPIVERLNKEVNAALKRPEVIEKLQSYGYAAEGSTPERLLEINRDDLALWRKLVKKAALPLE
jgi:hypothetical protein